MAHDPRLHGLISIRELVSRIASNARTTEAEAAAMLADYPFSNPPWFGVAMYEWQPLKGCRRLSDDDRMREAIPVLDEWGRGEISQASLHGMDDGRRSRILDRVGFRRSDALPLVEKIEESSDASPLLASATGSWPPWKYRLAEFEYLTDEEAAAALAGVDLSEFDSHLPYEQEEFRHLRELIRRSCEGGSLPAKILRVDDDGKPEWTIKPGDFAMWCDSRDIPYPLPGRDHLGPSTTDMAGDETAQAANSAILDLECEIQRLRNELCAKEKQLAMVVAELDKLRGDLLEGKRRTTALKIIGGMTMSAYRIDIHVGRFERIGEIVEDLERAGAGVTEKTLRELLKDAAKEIDPPRAP